MAVSGNRPSCYYRYLSVLLVFVLLMSPVRAAVVDASAPENSTFHAPPSEDAALRAERTCREVFVECAGGVANVACCYAIDEEIRRHKDGHSCVCKHLKGTKGCGMAGRCSKRFCPSCKPCAACPMEVDEP